MSRTTKTQADTKEQILAAAKREFAKKGYDGARMGAIARRAGVNQALLHYYFSNKENLYREVLILHSLFGARLLDRVQEFSDSLNLKPPEKLYLAIHLLVNVHLEAMDDDFSKIISREISEGREEFKALIRDYLIPRHETLEQAIIEGVESGDFATRNPLFVVIGLNVFVMNYINSRTLLEGSSWYERLYGKNHKEELLGFLLEQTFKALRPDKGRLKIPQIPEHITQALTTLIQAITQEETPLTERKAS